MFHPVSSLVASVECVCLPTLVHSFLDPGPRLGVEVSSKSRYAFLAVSRVLLDCSVKFPTWWSAYPEWVKYTLISLMRWWLIIIVLVMAQLRVCCRIFLLPWTCVSGVFPKFLTCLASTFRSSILHPICSLRARNTISSTLSLECSLSHVFFEARWMWCLYFCLSTFLVYLFGSIAAQIFATACHFCFCCHASCCPKRCFRSPSFLCCLFCCCCSCCLCLLHRSFAYTVAHLRHQCKIWVCLLLLSNPHFFSFCFHCCFHASCMLESLRQPGWGFACRQLHLYICRFLGFLVLSSWDYYNDIDSDTLKELHPTIVGGLALQTWTKGSWPRESLFEADVTCAIGKVCTCTLLMTKCSTSNTKRKKKTKRCKKHGCWWNRNCLISKSLESSDSVQQKKREPRDPGRHPEDTCGKYRSSSVLPDRFLSLIGSGLVLYTFRFGLGRDPSCPIATASRNILSSCTFILFNPSRSSWSSIHHDVLDLVTRALACPHNFSTRKMLFAELLISPTKKSVTFRLTLIFFLTLVLRDVGHFVDAQSHSIDATRWSALSLSSGSRITFWSFFCSQCLIVFKWSPSSTVFCCVDPWLFELVVAFNWVFGLIFSSLRNSLMSSSHLLQLVWWSCIWSWVQGSILQHSLTISHSVRCFLSSAISISFFVSLVPTSNLRIFHLFHGIVCASLLVVNPIFFFNHCCVNFFVGIVFERDVAVLIVVCVLALSIFTFISNATQIVSVFLVGLVFSFHNLFVSSFRLYDESKHFALRRFNHSSVFFRDVYMFLRRSSSLGLSQLEVSSCLYLWNVAQAALIRFQISVVSCCWKMIIYPKYVALSSLVDISTMMSSISISFPMFELWLLRIFVFPGRIISSTFSELRLKSHSIFWSCSFEEANKRTTSANLMFVKVMIVDTQAYTHSSFPLPMSSSSAFCRTVLESMLVGGSPCLVPFLVWIMSLSSSVSTVAFCTVCSWGGCNHVRYRRF